MKRVVFITTLFLALMTGCQTPTSTMPTSNTDSFKVETDTSGYEGLIKPPSEQKMKDSIAKSSVKIIKYYTTEPNSAGGVSCNIIWKNVSKKTIKYVYFTVVPYNAVDDVVSSEIGGKSEVSIRTTGPFKPNKTYGYETEWENLWYNSTIKRMKVESIEVIFMD